MSPTVQIKGSSTDRTRALGEIGEYPPFRGLRYEEEEALKLHFGGLTVPDARNRPLAVAVFFRDPEREERQTTYPYILLDFLGVRLRSSDEHRGVVLFSYEANTGNPLPDGGEGFFPIPIFLDYQVSVVSRVNIHDVILNDIMITTLMPMRFGQLNCPSGTVRRLNVKSMTDASSINSDNQRLFRKIWSIEISSEYTPVLIPNVLADQVNVQVEQINVEDNGAVIEVDSTFVVTDD